MPLTKILIADHQAVVRRGLRQILSEDFKGLTCGEVSTAEEVLDRLRRQKWDILILDAALPKQGWMELLKNIRAIRPHLPVLVFSMHPEPRFAVRVLKAGADGYLTKDSSAEELGKAVRKVLGGAKYVGSACAEKLAANLHADLERPIHESLSDREYQVMCLIALGKTPKEIADELSLSIKTISTYRARILEKTRMRSNAELIRYAIEHRLDVGSPSLDSLS